MPVEWTYPERNDWLERMGSKLFVASLVAVLAAVVGVVVVETDGNMFPAAACIVAAAVLIASCYRVEWGLYVFVGTVLFFDQYAIPGFDPLTFKALYFRNLKEISYLPRFSELVVNPLELQLVLLITVWFVVSCFKRDLSLVRIPMWGGALVFFLGVAAAEMYGLRRGGDFLPSLWEVRALVYLGILYVMVPQIIRTKEQVHTLIWVCIAVISFKAFQGIGRMVSMGLSTGGLPTLTNHEDPVFVLNLVVLLFALVLFGATTRQRTALAWLLLPLIVGFYTGERRAAYAAVIPTFVVFIAVLPRKQQWLFVKTAAPVVAALALYCAVFWNSDSKFASPVRLVKTGFGVDPETAGERYYSNLYREIEKYDLARTVQDYPVLGIGFGNKYEMPLPLVKIDFPLRDYISHDQILWVIVKMGAVGFCLFCLFFNSFACRAAFTLSRLRDPYLRAVVAVAVAAIVNQLVGPNYDLQMTQHRNMVFLGTFMGLLPVCEHIDAEQRSPH